MVPGTGPARLALQPAFRLLVAMHEERHVASDQKASGRPHRTTIYLAPELALDLKRLAAERRRPVNALLVEAAEALVLAHRADAARTDTGPSDTAGLSLRHDIDGLVERIAVLEAVVHGRATVASPEGERRILNAMGVRREARLLLEARAAPVPHRELLALLSRHFILPGKDASANLRTILVHPKATGFTFIKGQGYAAR